jgi:hypothetical protein
LMYAGLAELVDALFLLKSRFQYRNMSEFKSL